MSDLVFQNSGVPDAGSYDHPNQDAERKRAAEDSLRDQRLREVESAILSTPDGREWLWRLMSGLHTFEHRIAMSGSDYENGFFAGEREAGVGLLRRFARTSPADFAKMIVEHDR